ncbi:MAG TPA: rod shape-determining protein MreC [Terriglobales bacterium]|nr:rod shape-determining protein MreC [Terriglobales bacterium]
MENVISRVRNTANLIVLMVVILLQIIGLAVQVQRPSEGGSTRLIRVWAISIVTPLTRSIVHTENWFSTKWHDYVWLRGVRQENEDLRNEIVQMKMREIRLVEDANQARRLQLLLGFKQQYIAKTVAAQVISTTGSEFSRAVYIDKGAKDGLAADMPVVSPEGVVGKILRVFPSTSLVLLINDPTSGAGVILEKSRLQGIVKGSPNANGSIVMRNVMADEKVEVGDRILTSGGDRVFPKGMLVGTVAAAAPGQDFFLNIKVKPAAAITRLEEVLVITKVEDRAPEAVATDNPIRAIDVLAERLPTVAPPPPKPDAASPGTAVTGTTAATGATKPKPASTNPNPELNPAVKPAPAQAQGAEKAKTVKQAQTAKPEEVEPKDTPR